MIMAGRRLSGWRSGFVLLYDCHASLYCLDGWRFSALGHQFRVFLCSFDGHPNDTNGFDMSSC